MTPDTPATPFEIAKGLFLQGVRHHEAGQYAEAEAAFQASLQHLPARASTLMNLGAAQLALDKPEQALQSLDASTQAEPGDAQAWCHRARALQALGRGEEASEDYARALTLNPELSAARWHRSLLLVSLGFAKDALKTLQPLLDPPAGAAASAAPAWLLAGQAQQSLGQLEPALRHYQQARRLDAHLPRVHAVLGQLLQQLGRADEAGAVWSEALTAGVEPELNRYLLAGLGAGPASQTRSTAATPTQSPQAYVRALFDPYADGFEAHLVGALQYRGHEAVVDAALGAARAGGVAGFESVVDLGCGTGLCGRLLRPHAKRIEGIDLSPTMVATARASGAYEVVRQADAVEALRTGTQAFDLVVAADVLIYIGALEALFSALAARVMPGAWLSLSVETMGAEEQARHPEGWCLRASLRYAHTQAYLRELCRAQGWHWLAWQPFALRQEQGQRIEGAVALVRA